MRPFFILIACTLTIAAYSQPASKPLSRRVMVKTNLLSLAAQRPTLSVEKVFPSGVSAEVSFVQGHFSNFLLLDLYDYRGFLVRGKKYFTDFELGGVSPYAALYAGTLKRTVQITGQVDNTGFFGYPSSDFSANSIRSGASLGLCYLSQHRVVVDGLASLGYGNYTKIYKPDSNGDLTGYIDAQVWLSVGYCF